MERVTVAAGETIFAGTVSRKSGMRDFLEAGGWDGGVDYGMGAAASSVGDELLAAAAVCGDFIESGGCVNENGGHALGAPYEVVPLRVFIRCSHFVEWSLSGASAI